MLNALADYYLTMWVFISIQHRQWLQTTAL